MHWQEEYQQGKVLLINKPLGWTSFDVVKKVRILTRISKVGHAGTLDPLATGLLILCTGKFTKRINEYMAQEKEYTGTFTLGAVTPTYDLESAPVEHKDISGMTLDKVRLAALAFTGDILQVPPAHSAIKQEGIPVYKLARKGREVKLEPRKVTVKEFEVIGYEAPVVRFRVVCSTGTYIRSLANDLGQALGCGAHLSSLCRTRIGSFTLDEAMSVADVEKEVTRLKAAEAERDASA